MKFAQAPGHRSVCPDCGGSNIRKSRRKGPVEFVLRWIFNISPYRCMSCNRRYYRFRFHHPVSAGGLWPRLSPKSLTASPQSLTRSRARLGS